MIDVGEAYTVRHGPARRCVTPYKVATWKNIPAAAKASNGDWYNDYGGYISFGCNMTRRQDLPDDLDGARELAVQG